MASLSLGGRENQLELSLEVLADDVDVVFEIVLVAQLGGHIVVDLSLVRRQVQLVVQSQHLVGLHHEEVSNELMGLEVVLESTIEVGIRKRAPRLTKNGSHQNAVVGYDHAGL